MKQRMDDSELLAALAGGNLEALECLYDTYATGIFHVLLARGLGREAAEDVLQDVFLSLLDRGRAVRRIGNVPAYLITVARNMASRHLRRQRRQASLELVERLPAGPTAAEATQKVAVRQALRQLPSEQTENALRYRAEFLSESFGDLGNS